jgi:hypothetical protein
VPDGARGLGPLARANSMGIINQAEEERRTTLYISQRFNWLLQFRCRNEVSDVPSSMAVRSGRNDSNGRDT